MYTAPTREQVVKLAYDLRACLTLLLDHLELDDGTPPAKLVDQLKELDDKTLDFRQKTYHFLVNEATRTTLEKLR